MLRLLHRGALPVFVVSLQTAVAGAGPEAAACLQLTVDQKAAQVAGGRRLPLEELERLGVWLRAVREHEPGRPDDDAVRGIAPWSDRQLDALWQEAIRPQLQDCDRRIRQLLKARDEAGALTLRRAVDRVLRAGAMLHTDTAIAALPVPADATRTSSRLDAPSFSHRGAAVSAVSDGTHTRVSNAAGPHWTMARRLLDHVRSDLAEAQPAPARDPLVRSWYRATLAVMMTIPYGDTAHAARAEELAGEDAAVRMLVGSLHEWMASDSVQQAMETARATLKSDSSPFRSNPDSPRMGPGFPVRSARAELERARRQFEHAVRLDPSLTEARVRLGRVLTRLGQPQAAAEQLAAAAQEDGEPVISYFANLFLGALEESRERFAEAREAYERARSSYPDAPTPHLALSHLARRQGRRDEAFRLIGDVLAPPPDGIVRVDPMWLYSRSAGRHKGAMLRNMLAVYRETAASPSGNGPSAR